LVGATVHNQEELEALKGQRIDYIGVGPVFGTSSKDTGLPPLGLDGLARLCQLSDWPVIAIGSIGLEDVGRLKAAGAHGVAVISAFCLAEKPIAVAKAFLEKLAE
jgi:thiamine-phosphate pyrophosphorylase